MGGLKSKTCWERKIVTHNEIAAKRIDDMHSCKIGDLVKVCDGLDRDPVCIGVGMFLGIETKLSDITGKCYAVVLLDGKEQWFDDPYWRLEIIDKQS